MSFDGFFTHALVSELSQILVGGRVTKIYQPFEKELQIIIRNHRQNHRLAASIHPTYYHLALTDERPANPTHAPMFCMLLRKHLENALVLNIEQIENDRVIRMTFSGLDEIGDQQTYHLYFELMGRHSNIVLVNPKTQTIIDCIKHVASSLNSYRGLQPGALYRLPPQQENQINVLTHDHLDDWVRDHEALLSQGKGNQVIQGLGPLANRYIVYLIQEGNTAIEALSRLIKATQSPQPLLFDDGKKLYFYHCPLPYLEANNQTYPSLSALVIDYYRQKIHLDRINQVSGDLIQRLHQLIDKNHLKVQRLLEDRQVAKEADTYRIKGELLTAYAYQLHKGQTQVTLDNYYDDNAPLEITLNPQLSPIENSQAYFKKYSKYRDSLAHIDQQIHLTEDENHYLEGVLVQVQQAEITDIEDIKAELAQEGFVNQHRHSIKKRAKSTSKPRRFIADDGTVILVGRNNQQNDDLSLRQSPKNYWWLHAKNIPGSHVIIQSTSPSDETITLAGHLAAFYSKFSQSAQVPVDLLQVKHLKKPNGAKPGFVIYQGQQTIYVTPDASLIDRYQVEE